MKKLLLIALLFSSLIAFAQKKGQNFCEGDNTESFFTLMSAKKIIYWYDTYYVEEKRGLKTLNGKEYTEYSQTWEKGFVATLYLRQEDGKTFQYEECCDKETLRFDDRFNKGDKWRTADKHVEYEIVETNVTLKTPVCNYKNLVKLKYTTKTDFFEFYYLQGFGYIGASVEDNLVSFASAEFLQKKN